MSNGIFCYDCSRASFSDFPEDDECPNCGSTITGQANIMPCPAGDTAADWRAGKPPRCQSDIHEWATGMHVEEVDL